MRRRYVKSLLVVILAVIMIVALLGCNKNSQSSKTKDKVTITVWDFYGTTTPIKPLIPKFEKEFPNIKVDFQPQPWDNYWEKLATGASGGTLPDLATTGLMYAPQYTEYGIYADLTPYSKGKINGQKIEDVYSKGMLDAATKDGKLLGIPYDFDAYALYYRTDFLKEVGINAPPKTWEELVSIGKKITKDTDGDGKIDRYAYIVPADWAKFEPFLYGNGGSILNEDNTKALINSPEAVEALQFLTDLVNKYKIAVYWSPDQGSYISALKDGTVAMFMDGPYVMGLLKESAPELEGKWGVTSPIQNKQFGTHIGGTYLSIFETSKHKEEAWKFIEFLSREENQVQLYKVSGAAPAYLPTIDNKEVNVPDPYFNNQTPLKIFKDVVDKGRPNPIVPEWGEISQVINLAIEKAVTQEATPEEALDEAAEKINEILSK